MKRTVTHCEEKLMAIENVHAFFLNLGKLLDISQNLAGQAENRVKKRLQLMAKWIMNSEHILNNEHKVSGHVFIFCKQVGFTVNFIEDLEIIEDRDFFKARGTIILSVPQMVSIINELIEGLDKEGGWAEAVKFLNGWGTCFGTYT